MNIFQSIILGITQGITEFLPISSSGHLILIPRIFSWNDPGLSFTVALHWGTLFAVIGYFYKDWLKIFKNAFIPLEAEYPAACRGDECLVDCAANTGFNTPRKLLTGFIHSGGSVNNNQNKILYFILIATIPGALAGYFLENSAETIFRNPILVSIALIAVGIILYIADKFGKKNRETHNITLKTALIIGLTQVLAIIPGVSRSGITITAALFLGLSRKDAAHFSFLLATPIILGAGLIKLPDILNSGIDNVFIAGFLSSAVAGFLSIKWLLKYIQTKTYSIFVLYRIVLGILFLII